MCYPRKFPVYVIEVALKLSPLPFSVQRKDSKDAERLYRDICHSLEKGNPRLLELRCEKVEGKKLALLTSEILSVQMYEKTAASLGSKRPGFSFNS